MQRTSWFIVLLLALATSLAGCSKPAANTATSSLSRDEVADFLSGNWAGSMRLNDKVAAETLGENELDYVRSMKMDMTFHKDGKLDQIGEDAGKSHKDQGTWEFVSAEESGDTIRKITIKSKGSEGVEKTIDLILDGEDAFEIPLSMKTAQVGAMRFVRR